MCVPLVENLMCVAFEEYEEVSEMAPLDFSEDNITWVTSKLSDTAGVLGPEAIDLRNFLLFFGCVSEEFRVVVANMADWMVNSSHPWVVYHTLMAC